MKKSDENLKVTKSSSFGTFCIQIGRKLEPLKTSWKSKFPRFRSKIYVSDCRIFSDLQILIVWWNQFHGQIYMFSKVFSNFESMDGKNWLWSNYSSILHAILKHIIFIQMVFLPGFLGFPDIKFLTFLKKFSIFIEIWILQDMKRI